ncbi:hypothetical protein ACAD36_00149 [Clavibacter nebraskensis]
MYGCRVGLLQLNQIKKSIETELASLIDVSDVTDPNKVEDARTTRGLAAWLLTHVYGASNEDAAASVIDGYGDNGVDAVYYDVDQKVLCLVQTKWSKNGTGSPALGDVLKFVKGVRDVTNADFSKFNERFQAHTDSVAEALSELDLRLHIILAYSGSSKLSSDAEGAVTEFLDSMNDSGDTASLHTYSQRQLHDLLRASANGPRPTIDASLYDWGLIQEPYTAFYGQVDAQEVASWYETFGTRLFDDNIRHFLGTGSDVNESIGQTLRNDPEKFWYFNNGITVLCQSIGKRPLGGASRMAGHFQFREVSVVNGAQTVGTIGEVAREDKAAVANARVTVRFISLEGGPEDFATEVTRGTNTQNRVERRDFVSLDPEQVRLADSLSLEGVTYAIKSGSQVPARATGFTVAEATIGRACASSDPDLAVQAKREVGLLWLNAEAPSPDSQYRQLFHSALSEVELWRTVQCLRVIDEEVQRVRRSHTGRENLIGIHGNRLLAHITFQLLSRNALSGTVSAFQEGLTSIPRHVERAYEATVDVIAGQYPDNYLASLFKNTSRCRVIVESVLEALA